MAEEHLLSVQTVEVVAVVLNDLDDVLKVVAFQLGVHQEDHPNALAMMDDPEDLAVVLHLVHW